MVLADLGSRINASLKRLNERGSAQNQQNEQAVDEILEDVGKALLEADISVPYVLDLKKRIRAEVLDPNSRLLKEESRGAANAGFDKLTSNQKFRLVQRAVVQELTSLLQGGEACKAKREQRQKEARKKARIERGIIREKQRERCEKRKNELLEWRRDWRRRRERKDSSGKDGGGGGGGRKKDGNFIKNDLGLVVERVDEDGSPSSKKSGGKSKKKWKSGGKSRKRRTDADKLKSTPKKDKLKTADGVQIGEEDSDASSEDSESARDEDSDSAQEDEHLIGTESTNETGEGETGEGETNDTNTADEDQIEQLQDVEAELKELDEEINYFNKSEQHDKNVEASEAMGGAMPHMPPGMAGMGEMFGMAGIGDSPGSMFDNDFSGWEPVKGGQKDITKAGKTEGEYRYDSSGYRLRRVKNTSKNTSNRGGGGGGGDRGKEGGGGGGGGKDGGWKREVSNVVLFVGLQGAGKTTSITKYAHFYKRKGRGINNISIRGF
jgi:hypothetical protein